MILYDFGCQKCGTQFEALVKMNEHWTECPTCGLMASRQISPVRSKLEGVTGDFPTAAQKWTKMHEQGAKTKAD